MLKLRLFYCLYNVSSTSRRCSNQQYMEAHFVSLIITDETEKHHVQQLLYMPIYREMYIAFDLFNLTCWMKRNFSLVHDSLIALFHTGWVWTSLANFVKLHKLHCIV